MSSFCSFAAFIRDRQTDRRTLLVDSDSDPDQEYIYVASDPDQDYIYYFMGSETSPSLTLGSETLPSACYMLSDESSIPFYSTSNGYNIPFYPTSNGYKNKEEWALLLYE